ncbi:MAG: tRNA threonylcarbamoyladenosine biosynthesis [Prolixibacteraceae bacterium]|nr:MAG: tRNA threonylcarbamoyladenosine biosynthesis [Prolixibacteraceae bacterium]
MNRIGERIKKKREPVKPQVIELSEKDGVSTSLHTQIEKAAQIIRDGGLVAFPTETVYGLGANALNPVAVAKIFEMKERPSFDPLIVHIASVEDLKQLTTKQEENVLHLAEHFWPGPLTIVLPKSKLIPDIVTSGLPTVAIRMPNNKIALELIRRSGCPIAAPSANKFGKLSPVNARHVKKQFSNIDLIIDGGAANVGIESTIIIVEGNICKILRPGVITIGDIENAMPGKFIFSTEKSGRNISPGMLNSHYSPAKPLYILNNLQTSLPASSGIILHGKNDLNFVVEKIIYTSENHYSPEIAANLFSALHEMEETETIKQIYIEAVEPTGLGIAIMDRIKKAAYQYQTNI